MNGHTVTVTQAAELLGITRQAVHKAIKAGRLKVVATEVFPGRYGGGRLLLNRQGVEKLKDQQ